MAETLGVAAQPFGVSTASGADGTLTVRLSGDWRMHRGLPEASEVGQQLSAGARRIVFDASGLGAWDSSLVTFLVNLLDVVAGRQVEVDTSGLPEGVRRLLDLATAVPEKKDTGRGGGPPPFLVQIGQQTLKDLKGFGEFLDFLGGATVAFGRLLTGRAWYRRSDLWLFVQQCGAQALGIVTIISLLLGLILAFVGAVQLQQFGAQIFVADLVGIAMAREMAAVMTAIVMAGRTGAAFAAQLGTMRVNEEIDAFTTFGFDPMEFLVLPRMLALMLMMPLLALYANLMGMFGGWIVGVGLLDLTSASYIIQTQNAVTLTDFAIGLVKAVVFGALVAIAGCLRGMQSGRSSAAVGEAATSAVVTSIVLIIAVDGVFAVVTHILGI